MMQNKVYAITGGIGSGKSEVSKMLTEIGYPVFSADEIYKELLSDDSFVREIYESLGIEYIEGEKFDREKVSSVVFNSDEMLEKLNKVTHPRIMTELFKRSEGYSISFHEVPLLFETGLEHTYNKVIVVSRNIEQRINAVMQRDGLTREEVEKRMSSQTDYSNKDLSGCYIIYNNLGLDVLRRNVERCISDLQVVPTVNTEVAYVRENKPSTWPLAFAILGMMANVFFGIGFIFGIIGLSKNRAQGSRGTNYKWTKTIGILDIIISAVIIVCVFIYMGTHGSEVDIVL